MKKVVGILEYHRVRENDYLKSIDNCGFRIQTEKLEE